MNHTITNQPDLRAAFWEAHGPRTSCPVQCRTGPGGRILPQNSQSADTRAAWVDYVDACARNGAISEALASRATL